jgi:hypothetical protein
MRASGAAANFARRRSAPPGLRGTITVSSLTLPWRLPIRPALNTAGKGDPYLVGVQMTCQWLAATTYVFNCPHGLVRQLAGAPITKTKRLAHEELIELETQAAERRLGREWPGRPGYAEGVVATLQWAWRRSGRSPIEVMRPSTTWWSFGPSNSRLAL